MKIFTISMSLALLAERNPRAGAFPTALEYYLEKPSAPNFRSFAFNTRRKTRRYIDVLDGTNGTFFNGTTISLTNDMDIAYLANVTLGGKNFTVELDTGSSDLWIMPGSTSLTLTNATNMGLDISYPQAYVSGVIDYAALEIGGYEVPWQAFLNANESQTLAPNTSSAGVFGLGLDNSSLIYQAMNTSSFAAVSNFTGLSALPPLANIFALNASLPNFIGLSLERSNDTDGSFGGLFSISEYDPRFSANITNATKITLVTPNSTNNATTTIGSWYISLDGISVADNLTNLATDNSTGSDNSTTAALISSANSLTFLPTEIVDSIYSNISGSIHLSQDNNDMWIVPCLSSTNVSLVFGNQTFAIDPLDLASPQIVDFGTANYTVCINNFVANSTVGNILLGDSFLRNVYTVFNYGNATLSGNFTESEEASIQFVSRTNASEAFGNFIALRNATLQEYPTLLDISI